MSLNESPQPLSRKYAGDVAIIGMACMFPGAPDLDTYWQNILGKVDAVTDPPPEAWDANLFFDPNSTENDRLYCKRGGFLGPYTDFNPFEFGIMPSGLEGGEPDQWLALKLTQDALKDANYLERLKNNPEERHNTAIILGKGTYLNRGNLNMVQHSLMVDQTLQILKTLHPEYAEADLVHIREALKKNLPPFNAEAAPGLIPNIITGRVANRMDFMGPTYTVDAACASSLIALENAVQDLLTGRCDLAIAGGAQVTTPIPIFTLFCQLNALSRQQEIRPFDEKADGTILGEGIGILVLKRREDAERNNDRVYAYIKGVGTASDGRALGVLAPRLEGEVLAMKRAYDKAGIPPETIGLIEAHGTGTPVGDLTEIKALAEVFSLDAGQLPYTALGSVKSMIGHTMPAAGIAGVIKSALALYHKVLPPTLHCEYPHPELEKTACYANTETRPWIHGHQVVPRRAGVNAFGFGGINAHLILEEDKENREVVYPSHMRIWDSEVVILQAGSREGLVKEAKKLQTFLASAAQIDLIDLAYTLNTSLEPNNYRLALVADHVSDLQEKLAKAQQKLQDPNCHHIKNAKGIYFFEKPLYPEGKLAFLFPGEGSQYTNMLADLCLHFPQVRACFDRIDRNFIDHPRNFLPSDFIFPRPSHKRYADINEQIWHIDGAIEAVLTGNLAMHTLLTHLGIQPDALAGHSTGEYSAMLAAGIIPLSEEDFVGKHLVALNRQYQQIAKESNPPSAMLLAVGTDVEAAARLIEQVGGDIFIGMDNCPHQTVIIGEASAIEKAKSMMRDQGLIFQSLPFDRPYHTPLFETYGSAFNSFFEQLPLKSSEQTVYSCITAARYPQELREIRQLVLDQSIKPVRFRETIQAMYADNIRLFVEAGPRGGLSSFVEDTLRGKPHLAIPANLQRRSGISQLNHLVGLLGAQGVPMDLAYLYTRRQPKAFSITPEASQESKPKAGTIKLKTGWAGMGISPDDAAQFRLQPADMDRKPDESPDVSVGSDLGLSPAALSQITPDSQKSQAKPSETAHSNENVGRDSQVFRQPAGQQKSQVLNAHFKLMEQFLETQQAAMVQYLNRSAPRQRLGNSNDSVESAGTEPQDQHEEIVRIPSTSPSINQYPFIREIQSFIPGSQLVALCELSLTEDLYLRDHTLGREVSKLDEALQALSIVPLTISMEIMAQAAAVLLPDLIFIGMKEVRASRWITLEKEKAVLRIVAERQPAPAADEVRVSMYVVSDMGANQMPVVEGEIVFAQDYPERPPVGKLVLQNERPSKWQTDQLYTSGMFHGPAFQAVESIEHWGSNGLLAVLQTLPDVPFLRSTSGSPFLSEPVILDAAGQLVGFWTMEHLETGYVVFPYYFKALQFYGPPIKTSQKVHCQAKIDLIENLCTRTDFEISNADGALWIRLEGWEDKRFDIPRRFYEYLLSSDDQMLSEVWDTPVQNNHDLVCCRAVDYSTAFFESHAGLWKKVLAFLVLSPLERTYWQELKGPPKRRVEWLLGRLAAKDAVRLLVKQQLGLSLNPADIEIMKDEQGRPFVDGLWVHQLERPINITIAHTDGVAVSAAGFGEVGFPYGIGIDIETTSRQSQNFQDVAFTSEERSLLANLDAEAPVMFWPLRLWCAKEAAGKALGSGLIRGPLGVEAKDIDPKTGVITLRLNGEMKKQFLELEDMLISAYTAHDSNFITACVAEIGSESE